MKTKFLSALREKLPQAEYVLDEPMSAHTSFKVGGPADIMLLPGSEEEVAGMVCLAKECGLPFIVLGKGSNLLVRDRGIRGLVLKIGDKMASIVLGGTTVTCGAGATLAEAAGAAAGAGLTGLEFASGIPGSVGGGVCMNAGAYDGEMKDVLLLAEALTLDGEIITLPRDEMQMSYRHSLFSQGGHVVLKGSFQLRPGKEKDIREKMADLNQRRRLKQPLDMPSAGSTFKRPANGYASCLIDEAGLKGFSVGGAQVSEKHAGFIVNKGGATASDILRLIEEVQKRVQAASGIELKPEVKIVGE